MSTLNPEVKKEGIAALFDHDVDIERTQLSGDTSRAPPPLSITRSVPRSGISRGAVFVRPPPSGPAEFSGLTPPTKPLAMRSEATFPTEPLAMRPQHLPCAQPKVLAIRGPSRWLFYTLSCNLPPKPPTVVQHTPPTGSTNSIDSDRLPDIARLSLSSAGKLTAQERRRAKMRMRGKNSEQIIENEHEQGKEEATGKWMRGVNLKPIIRKEKEEEIEKSIEMKQDTPQRSCFWTLPDFEISLTADSSTKSTVQSNMQNRSWNHDFCGVYAE